MDALDMSNNLRDIKKACEFIYGERWESVKKMCLTKLEAHQKENNTVNLLSSAIQLCENEKDDRMKLILLWSSV